MTATITADIALPPDDWYWAFSSDLPGTPAFYLYVDEQLVEHTTRPFYQLTLARGEQVQFEVLDDAAAVPEPAYPSRAVLAWYGVDGVASYAIDEYVDAAWVRVQTVIPQRGQGYFASPTRVLEDQETHRFRVTPIGENGVEGTPREFEIPMVCRPVPAQAVLSYSALTGLLTVSPGGA